MVSGGRQAFPDDLDEVAEMLRSGRSELDSAEAERIKLRVMKRVRQPVPARDGRFFRRSRLATAFAVGLLTLGTGGALAVAGGNDHGRNNGGSASFHQYRPPCPPGHGYGDDCCKPGWGYGDDNHCHTGPPGHGWYSVHGWCWLADGHGGFKWGYGYGWEYH